MKTMTAMLVAGLCLVALAGDNAVIAPRVAAGSRAAPTAKRVVPLPAVAIPHVMSYQGRLTDTAGRAVPDGVYAITFSLYVDSSGGSAFWTEQQNVQVTSGLFSVRLGSVTPLSYLSSDGNGWLEMQVQPDPAMTPRIRIASSGYAYFAEAAAKADSARPQGYAGGDLTGDYPSPTIGTGKVNSDKVQDNSLRGADFKMPCSLYCQSGNPYAALMIRAVNTGNGIRIDTADNVGIYIKATRNNGIVVDSAGSTGIDVYAATSYGIRGKGYAAGGYFTAGDAGAVGMIARSYNGVATDTAIHAEGKGIASGGWSTGFKDGGEAPSVVAAERMIIASGSARLSGGSVEISLPETFAKRVRPDIPVRLNVTPTSDAPGLLVAERRGNSAFSVRLRRIALLEGSEDGAFDWIAAGVLEEPSSEPVPDLQE